MAVELRRDGALQPLAPGKLIRISQGALAVDVAPDAGGRIAQIAYRSVDWLIGHGGAHTAAIAWGSYPMLPWAGRLRAGSFAFGTRRYYVTRNLGEHAIHGVGFAAPWKVDACRPHSVELSLHLPEDERWPFGGVARQRIDVGERSARLHLSVTAGAQRMPCVIGWHPWFRKPDRLVFRPQACYPRDAQGIAVPPAVPPPRGPWDDCFANQQPVQLWHADQRLQLTSDCTYWVIYDEPAHATCVEPQSGLPDAFNQAPLSLAPGESASAWFELEWL